jgi:hypothetical protein
LKKKYCVLCPSGVHNESVWRKVCGGHSRTQSVCLGPSQYGLCPSAQGVKSQISDPMYSLFPQQTGDNGKILLVPKITDISLSTGVMY